MTRDKLAKKLEIAIFNVEDSFWNLVEVELLLSIINKLEKKNKKLRKKYNELLSEKQANEELEKHYS